MTRVNKLRADSIRKEGGAKSANWDKYHHWHPGLVDRVWRDAPLQASNLF